jgi:hypothetical protein
VSHEIQKGYSKPALNAESFQRLLAAAYILQSHNDPAAFPGFVPEKKPFVAGAIIQKRTTSVQPSLARSLALRWRSAIRILTVPMLWKSAEAFAIAAVFCLMMGMSIHHLLASPGRTTPSATTQAREADHPASSTPQVLLSSVLASPQPDSTRRSRQSHDDADEAETEINDDDLIIHYRPRTLDLSGPIGKGMSMHEANRVTARVVRYGDDVTMWSSTSALSEH